MSLDMDIANVGYPGVLAENADAKPRIARDACVIIQDGHGRYLEPLMRGNCFSIMTAAAGITLGANNAILTAATAQPIVGIWNPPGSGVYANILEVIYGPQATGAAAVNEGIPVYQIAVAGPQAIISQAGTQSTSMKTLTIGGGKCLGLLNQALTGNTAAWTQLKPFVGGGPRFAAPTASINVNGLARDETAGTILVPPGVAWGLFVLASGTAITVGASALYEEIPAALIA